MPWFEIVYSEEPVSKAVHSNKVSARDRAEAAELALNGLAKAQEAHGAKCFRVLDGLGMVVARGPKAPSPSKEASS